MKFAITFFISLSAVLGIIFAVDFSGKRVKKSIGGDEADPNEFPFLVGIWLDGKLNCGGVLLKENFVLTAAHCFYDVNNVRIPIDKFKIFAGDHDLNLNETTEQSLPVRKLISHPEYFRNANVHGNDIGLVLIDGKFSFGGGVENISLPYEGIDKFLGASGVVPGWGTTNEDIDEPSPVLQKVRLNFVADKYCGIKYEGFSNKTKFCAGSRKGDICSRDSGSPFLIGDEAILYGIVSYNRKCADDDVGSVFMKVEPFVKWIQEVMEKEENGMPTWKIVLITVGSVAGLATPFVVGYVYKNRHRLRSPC